MSPPNFDSTGFIEFCSQDARRKARARVPDNAEERLLDLTAALDVLTHAPEIGRRVGHRSRELVIGRGARGYVARYEYVARLEAAFILRVHHQREDR